MLHAHPPVPLMKTLKQNGLQPKRVIGGGVGDTHHLGEDEKHKQVVFVSACPGYSAPIGSVVKLAEERPKPAPPGRTRETGHCSWGATRVNRSASPPPHSAVLA